MVSHMVLDASRLQHSRCSNDDTRFVGVVEPLRLVDILDILERVEPERVAVEPEHILYSLVEVGHIQAEDLGSIDRERRIDIHGDMRQAAVVIQIVEHVHYLLRSANRERRNEQFALLAHTSVLHHLQQFLLGSLFALVQPVAIGGLGDQVVALRERHRRG